MRDLLFHDFVVNQRIDRELLNLRDLLLLDFVLLIVLLHLVFGDTDARLLAVDDNGSLRVCNQSATRALWA